MKRFPSWKKEDLRIDLSFLNIQREFTQSELSRMLKIDVGAKSFQDLWKELVKNKVFQKIEERSGAKYYSMDKTLLRKYIEQNSKMFKQIYKFMSQRKFLGIEEFYYPLS